MATFTELKSKYAIAETLGFNPDMDKEEKPTGWFSAFHQETRTQWSIAPSAVPVLKTSEALFIRTEDKVSAESSKPYTHILVLLPKEVPAMFA